MAKRNSMSTAHRSRNPHRKRVAKTEGTESNRMKARVGSQLVRPSAHGLASIASRRIQLMKAEAVLACVAFTLVYEDWLDGPNRPTFADAVAAARDLVAQAVEQLGST